MNGVVWTTLPALRAAGARVQARKDGLEIRIEHVGATATIRPYRAVASTPDGKEYALGVPVFVGIDGPMVPLHALAKALRCQARVSAKGVSFR